MAWPEILLRLGVAAVIGVAIGLDRELLHKSAGMRTIGLVALGAALATMLIGPGDTASTARIIQGVLTGIGFLGAGVIVRHKTSVDGLTTAASIWTAAVLGAGAGVAAWPVVMIGAALTLVLLILARLLERRLLR